MAWRRRSHLVTVFLSMEEIVQQYSKTCRLVLIETTSLASEMMRSRFEPIQARLLLVADYFRQCVKSPQTELASWLLEIALKKLHVLQH